MVIKFQNMKKLLLLGIASMAAAGLVSCEKESENYSSATISVKAYNLFTPVVAGKGDPFISNSVYSFVLTMPQDVVSINAGAMAAPGGNAVTFTTSQMPIDRSYPTVDNNMRETDAFNAANPSLSGADITNLKGVLTTAIYAPQSYDDPTFLPDYTWILPASSYCFAFMQYQYGTDWNVRTFWPDMTYRGNTVTTYPQMPEPFNSDSIEYRVVMKTENGLLTGKADVIMYNAQFAPQAPPLEVVLVKDLDLAFSDAGYTISGKDLIPYYLGDGGELLENKRFMFNSLEATVQGDLTNISISYQVAGMYNGSFNGSCYQK